MVRILSCHLVLGQSYPLQWNARLRRDTACATWKQAHHQAKDLCLSVQPEPVAFIKVDGEGPSGGHEG